MTDMTTVPAKTVALDALLVIALSTGLGGCRAEAEPAVQVTRQTQVAAKAIGDPCKEGDGWTPEPIQGPANPAEPVMVAVPAGYVDYPQVSPGVAYCMRESVAYPYGYYTMNCATDADCPSSSRCDGTLCRAPCTQDADCVSPMTCCPVTNPSGVRYCINSAALNKR
jgi:hypothetical protein